MIHRSYRGYIRSLDLLYMSMSPYVKYIDNRITYKMYTCMCSQEIKVLLTVH